MHDQKEVQLKIEKLVQGKKTLQASLLILKYFAKFGHKNDVLFECCDWFRRLGLYQKGISLLKINSSNLKIALSTSTKEGRKILWFARLSNLLGASTIAKRLIANITPYRDEDHRIFGLINLTNFSFEKAYQSFSIVCGEKVSVATYQDRMNVLNLADAAIGLKKYSEAIALYQKLQPAIESEFEKALVQQALGEAFCHLSDWDNAFIHLKNAESFYKKTSTNIDLAFLQKWLSLCSLKTGKTKEGLTYIQKSITSLVKLSAKEDALILALDVAALNQSLTEEQSKKLKFIKTVFYGSEMNFSPEDGIGSAQSVISINWSSQEVHVRTKKKSTFHFEINKELFFLLLLKLFEDWGINSYRVYDLLYSDDPFGIINAKDRIKSLSQRLHKVYGIKVLNKGQRLFITKASSKKIRIDNLSGFPRYAFIQKKSAGIVFKTKDVMNFYLISRSQAHYLLQRWQNENLIMKHENSYRITGLKS